MKWENVIIFRLKKAIQFSEIYQSPLIDANFVIFLPSPDRFL